MKSRPLTLDAKAESANPALPAFLARPEGAPVYHGFPVVEGVDVEGFRLGMITDFESSPEDGDAFVVAPDGSRAGLVWCLGDAAGLEEVCPLDASRWGVWAVTLPEPMKSKEAMQRNLAVLLPKLKEKWLRWKEQEPLPVVTPDSAPVRKDRWGRFLKRTIAINIVCFLLYPALICGCHFHLEALVVAAVPFLWGFYPYFFYRSRGEHIVGYLAIGLSMLWLVLEIENNSQFLIRHIIFH